LTEAGYAYEREGSDLVTRDPWGTQVRLEER
jgi:hypothetical protein